MKTCNDCIHSDVCSGYIMVVHFSKDSNTNAEGVCPYFKHRSRFVELPCDVGDIVYCLIPPAHRKVTRYIICKTGLEFVLNDFAVLRADQIGKTVFLTKEEAEQAIKEREKR